MTKIENVNWKAVEEKYKRTKPENVKWDIVERRLNRDWTDRYGRVLLNPDPNCIDCNGTGISKHSFDCGAINCRGHNDIICSCREFELDCPYADEHPNVSGNWTTVHINGKIYVKCYNVEAHLGNPYALKNEIDRDGHPRNVLFLVHKLNPI